MAREALGDGLSSLLGETRGGKPHRFSITTAICVITTRRCGARAASEPAERQAKRAQAARTDGR